MAKPIVVGVTVVRGLRTMHYPLSRVLASFAPCDAAVVYGDAADLERDALGEVAREMRARVVYGEWSLPTDAAGAAYRRTLRATLESARLVRPDATHVLFLEADEVMDPAHVKALLRAAPPVAWLPRLQLWQTLTTLRLDWTVTLPRFAALDALLPGLERADGDGGELPVKPDHAIAQFPEWPIWHLSRLGSAYMIARRREGAVRLWAPGVEAEVPEEYDFIPRHHEDWTPGKMPPPVEGLFAKVSGVPKGVAEWVGEDLRIGHERRTAALVARVEGAATSEPT